MLLVPIAHAQDKDKNTEITADFLPHKSGTTLYYDTQMNLPDGSVAVSRWKHVQKDDGVVEETLENIGSLKAKQSILDKGAKVTWLNKVDVPVKSSYQIRNKNGYIEKGKDHAGKGEIVWEPVLKIGAKLGDVWTWDSPAGVNRYEVSWMTKKDGHNVVTILITNAKTKANNTVGYIEGKGEAWRWMGVEAGGGRLNDTGAIKLVEEIAKK
jgi:hypothetical protein